MRSGATSHLSGAPLTLAASEKLLNRFTYVQCFTGLVFRCQTSVGHQRSDQKHDSFQRLPLLRSSLCDPVHQDFAFFGGQTPLGLRRNERAIRRTPPTKRHLTAQNDLD